MKPKRDHTKAALKAIFLAGRANARDAMASLAEAPPGWDVECRGDAQRGLGMMMHGAQTLPEVLEVVSMRGLLLQSPKGL